MSFEIGHGLVCKGSATARRGVALAGQLALIERLAAAFCFPVCALILASFLLVNVLMAGLFSLVALWAD